MHKVQAMHMHYVSEIINKSVKWNRFDEHKNSKIMRVFLIGLVLFLNSATTLFGQVNPNNTYVNGYYKSNGTYVQGYHRTTPNKTINDNYSTYPNVNPYNGKQGTVQPNYYQNNSRNSYPSAPKVTTPNHYYRDRY